MSIFDPAYQEYQKENYDEDDSEVEISDEEMKEFQDYWASNTATEKCTECAAEIKVYVGPEGDALDWREVRREPETEEEKKLYDVDDIAFLDREFFIKPEYLICGDCKSKQTEKKVDHGDAGDDHDDILF